MRYYKIGDNTVPSVTAIIRRTESEHNKIKTAKRIENYHKRRQDAFEAEKIQKMMDALASGDLDLAERLAQETNTIDTQAASNRGNVIHDLAFKYLVLDRCDRDEFLDRYPIADEYKGYWSQLEPELRILGKPILLECPVFNRDLGYAGRIDTYCYHNESRVLIDYKTFQGWESVDPKTGEVKQFNTWFLFKKLKKGEKYSWEWDKLSDRLQYAALQSTAYRMGLEKMGFPVDEVRILVINPHVLQRITIPQSIWPEIEQVWQGRVREFYENYPEFDEKEAEIIELTNNGYSAPSVFVDFNIV